MTFKSQAIMFDKEALFGFKKKVLTGLSFGFKQVLSFALAASSPDQKISVSLSLSQRRKTCRGPFRVIKRTATCTWFITSICFGIGWNWARKGERNRLITIFSVIWSIHNKKSQRCFMFPCHRSSNIKASYLPQSWLPEKAFSQAKKILVFSRYKDGTMQPKVRYGQQCYMWAGFYLLWI